MRQNVSKNERIASGALAVLFLADGLRRFIRTDGHRNAASGTLQSLAGAALAFRGLTGHCPVKDQALEVKDQALKRLAARQSHAPCFHQRSILINRPKTEVAEALGIPTGGGGPLVFKGDRQGIAWKLRLEDYAAQHQTRVVAEFKHSGQRFVVDGAIEHLVGQELRNIKALLETGEIATTQGQPEGKRGAFGASIVKVATTARASLDALAKRSLQEAQA